MKREEIIRMAREAGIGWAAGLGGMDDFLEHFAALVAAAERQKRMEAELMAECMSMVRDDLIEAGIVDRTVPPMMVPEAVLSAVTRAVAAEREACARVVEEAMPLGKILDTAAAIRARGDLIAESRRRAAA